MPVRLLGQIVALLLLSAVAARADEAGDSLQRGRQAAHDGDYATAVAIYQRLAQDGQPEGLLSLGSMYALGAGVRRDPVRACDLYRQAADQGLAAAELLVGDCFANGTGRPRDYAEAKAWYEKAAAAGYPKALCALGTLYRDGLGVPRDTDRGMALCQRAADLGDADAQADLAAVYLAEQSPEAHAKAFALLTKAAAQGQANGAFNLGMMYWNGDSTAKNTDTAARYFVMAWKGGSQRAPYMLGQYYFMSSFDTGFHQIRPGPGVQAMYWLSIAEKIDPNADNRARSVKIARMLNGLAPGLGQALDAWLKTGRGPPPPTE